MTIEIYTDGAYSPALQQGGVGLIFLRDGHKVLEWSKGFKNTTNNRCELYAVIKALQSISKKVDYIKIYSDSQYVIFSITKGWKRKKNIDLWEKFDLMYNKAKNHCKDIQFIWVKGHDTNELNNRADVLAVEASKQIL